MELLIFPWFVFWLAFSVIVGVFASQRRNRDGFGWFLLALVISPVLAFLLVAAMKEAPPQPVVTRVKLKPIFTYTPKPDSGGPALWTRFRNR